MRIIEEILADYLAGEPLSKEEAAFLKNRLMRDKGDKEFVEFWRVLRERYAVDERMGKDSTFAYRSILMKIRRKSRFRKMTWWSSVAAGIILFVGIFFMYDYLFMENIDSKITHLTSGKTYAELKLDNGQIISLTPDVQDIVHADSLSEITNTENMLVYTARARESGLKYNTLRIPIGAEYNLLLADGTKVCLNSGSEIRYPVAFQGDQREVFLTGEAFFQVARDETRKFVVRSGQQTVVVLGTSFNIRSYSQQDFIATTLQEGALQILLPDTTYRMYPGSQVVFDKKTNESSIREVNSELYTSWKDGYYFFDQTSLEEILSTISLWYNLTVVFEDPEAKSLLFTGQLKRYADIQYLLKKFEDTNAVEFIFKENKVIIKNKTNR
ncbi:FecR family protein [Butyricimonas paravirosa]|uniref:FecR family protein n=1 Tax=Butyricimonas paravirosa TaxID=1472417 RepID=UPI00210E2B04|nr:FecR domain-containing protein [Butyricimonas paravirosa]MCQ4872276.1 FecR domain-containing protein [Butyricimonas paravirosa]